MFAVFPSPAWQRLLIALAYTGVVAMAVWAVERTPAIAARPAAQVPASTSLPIRVEATFPVAHWTVLVDGVAVDGQAEAQAWTGTLTGREVLVQAERADAADLSPGALRLGVGSRSVVAWGEGTVSATLGTDTHGR